MKKEILIAIGITILFLGVSIAPSITADVDKSSTESFTNPTSCKTVEIKVSRYKADSTVEKTKVILSKENSLEFNERYKVTVDSDKRFSLLKEYGLIPEDVTRERLRQEMLMLAEELGFTEEKIESISERFMDKERIGHFIGINFLNDVGGSGFITLNLPIGPSLITGLINYYYKYFKYIDIRLNSTDLSYSAFYIFGGLWCHNGLLPEFISAICSFFSLFGFVGYVISIPFFSYRTFLEGFAVASLAFLVNMGPP